jgi:glycerophosphoryl diester phosphodiesterase
MKEAVRSLQIVAHRGAMDKAPENTASAFEAALSHRIDGIELDIQMTADGVLVIYHDETLNKITGTQQTVSELTYDELAARDWGAWYGEGFRGERLLTLEDCLARFLRRTRLLLEIKSFPRDQASGRSTELTRGVVRLLEKTVGPIDDDRIRILSFDSAVLAEAGRTGRWKCVHNHTDASAITRLEAPPDYLDAYCAAIDGIDPGTVDACHALGRRFMTWSCNRPRQVEKAIVCRCDVVMTDRPGWIVRYLDTRNRR